jgi:2'-5' RNA ligase
MAYISFMVPPEAAAELASLYTVGDLTPPEDMHVTLAFLSKNTPPSQVMRAIAACQVVAATSAPVLMHAALLTAFPPNPDHREGVPVIVRVISDALFSFRARLVAELEKFGVEYSKKFPEYKPHVTLSHSSERPEPQKVGPVSWTSDTVMVWGGEDHHKGLWAGVELTGRP